MSVPSSSSHVRQDESPRITQEPFWIEAQTNLLRWIRNGHRLAGEPEPGIRSVAEIAQNRAKLEALVKKAVDRAETPDERTEARELERWLTRDWLPLGAALASRQTTTLTLVGSWDITVTSRDGTQRTRVGERTGSWDSWDPASLPVNGRRAAWEALAELRGGRPSTIHDNPIAQSRARATRPRHKSTTFEVVTESIDTIEQAARSAKTTQRRLKNDLTHRNKSARPRTDTRDNSGSAPSRQSRSWRR